MVNSEMQKAVMIAAGIILAVIATITTIQSVYAYNAFEIMRIEAGVTKLRIDNLIQLQALRTDVTKLYENVTKIPDVGASILVQGVTTAQVGGWLNWITLRTAADEYRTQALKYWKNMNLVQVIETGIVIKILDKVLESEQTLPEGRIIDGINKGMTVEEILAPLQSMTGTMRAK